MDKKEYYLYVKGKAVPVSEEVYKAYLKITEHATLYNTLLNKIGSLSKGKEFVLRELIATPLALIGRCFYENVNNGLVKNVEHIGKAEGGVEKYKRI